MWCCRSEAVVYTEEEVGQQRRLLSWKQTLGPELSLRRAEGVLHKWQVGPLPSNASFSVISSPAAGSHILRVLSEEADPGPRAEHAQG